MNAKDFFTLAFSPTPLPYIERAVELRFCAALLDEDVGVIERVLRRYMRLRDGTPTNDPPGGGEVEGC